MIPASSANGTRSAPTRRTSPPSGLLLVLASMLVACLPGSGAAQANPSAVWSIGVDGELVSQYVWRGLQLNSHPSIQPEAQVVYRSVTLGAWASYPFDGSYREIDTYLDWSYQLPTGALELGFQDYFFPESGGFFDFSQATAAHTGEVHAAYTPSVVPVTVLLAWNVYDDPGHSLFAKVSGRASLHVVDLDANIGLLLKDSPGYYGGRAGDATNYTVRATRSFPLGVGNPHVSVALTRSALLRKTLWVFAVGM